MIAVMYHYVRPKDKHLAHSHFLDLEDFRRQLDYMAANGGVVERQAFLEVTQGARAVPAEGFVLTFDDGLKDHYQYVLPELIERNLWGVFFVPSGHYQTKRLLNVHALHLLLGKHGGEKVCPLLEGLINKEDIEKDYLLKFKKRAYKLHQQDSQEARVKRLVNYYLKKERLDQIIDRLAQQLAEPLDVAPQYYLSPAEIRAMDHAGMIIGGHGKTHSILSQLSPQEQEEEIAHSLDFLSSLLGNVEPRPFCYPHGQPFTYNDATLEILRDRSCNFAFAVEQRAIAKADIDQGALCLPRFDCNRLDAAGPR